MRCECFRQRELREVREKGAEWGWRVGDGDEEGTTTTTRTHNSHSQPRPADTPQPGWQEHLNQQLSRRVEELEHELVRLREAHQEEVAALQDHHRHHLLSLNPPLSGAGGGDGSGVPSPASHDQNDDGVSTAAEDRASERCLLLEREKDELQRSLNSLQARLEDLAPKADAASQLEVKLSLLNERYAALQKENEQSKSDLVELDTQHQQALEQILKKKNQILEEAQVMKADHEKAMQVLAESQADQHQAKEELKSLQAELTAARLQEEDSQTALNHQLVSCNKEISDLKSEVNDKIISLLKLEEQVHDMNKVRAENARLEEELKAVREKEQFQYSQIEEKNIINQELVDMQKKYEDEKILKLDLETKLGYMKDELENLKSSEVNLEKSCKLSEERRDAAEAKVTHLEQQVAGLVNEISGLRQTVEQTHLLRESHKEENQRTALEERINVAETTKDLLNQELQKCRQSLEDAQACSEILESELQAKVQELTMSNTTIAELEARAKQAENDLTDVDRSKTDEMEEVKKALAHHSQEVPRSVKAGVHRLAELLRDSVWQRDTLERHVSTVTQELREKNDLLSEAELSRAELERECEDLRDQLEEVQKGVRPQPEGSSRGLPTIEEEAEGGTEGETEGDQSEEGHRVKEEEQCEPPELERSSEIEALQAQVEALSEARRNLETEVSNIRAERERLQGQLREAEGRTGNLANLETEAVALRGVKKTLEMQLEAMTQELDMTTVTLQDERDTLKEQLNVQNEQIQCFQTEVNIMKHERNSIGQQLLTQYQVIEERDATIRILESEIDGLKDTLRETYGTAGSQQKPLETSLQEELNNIKSQLIYKEDKVDAFSQALEQIGQIFQIENCSSNMDDICKLIRSKYTVLEKSMKEKEEKVEELTKKIADLQTEFESVKKIHAEHEAEYSTKISETEKALNLARENNRLSEIDIFRLLEEVEKKSVLCKSLEERVIVMQGDLDAEKLRYSEAKSVITQTSEELMQVKEECRQLQCTLEKEKEQVLQLKGEREEVARKNSTEREAAQDMFQAVIDKDQQLAERDDKIAVMSKQINELEKDISELKAQKDEWVSQSVKNEDMIKQEHVLKGENAQLLKDKSTLVQENEKMTKEKEELEAERKMAFQQVENLQRERDQMIATVTHKHQESLSYHAEIQRLTQVLTQATQQHGEERTSLKAQLQESEATLLETRSLVTNLREELQSLTKIKSELERNAAEGIVKTTELNGLRKEIESHRAKLSALEQERDQLRVANSQFNAQYQEQNKELSSIKEKESRLSGECERLRQHLVTVEETYTAEALKGEEREATLRSTLSKMEEKLNNHSNFFNSASQRASVQVEALQEQLQEISSKRDDAVLRLHIAEESAEQHRHSLETLQQVLQDFQKNQAREISEATERTRRKLEEEQEKSTSLTAQLTSLKSQLAEAQGGLAAASRLGEQLTKKEQMIVALKAQVSSQEEVAKQARDEVSCLKNSSEGKVEKPLLRNLLVGYFATPVDKRQEVLRIIAEVLDFSGEERTRTGLDTQGTSWLSSIANFLAPPASNVRVTSKVDVLDHTSLSQAFIRFLEDESNPRPQPRLPAVQMAQQTTEKAEKKAQAKAQAASKINPFISSGDTQLPGSGQSSRNSSPLLAAASSPPTLPTIAPLTISTPPTLVTPTTLNPGAGESPSGGVSSSMSTNKYLTSLLTSDSAKSDENANKPLN